MVKLSKAAGHFTRDGSGGRGFVAASEQEDIGIYTISAQSLAPLTASAGFNATFDWETTSGLPNLVTDFTELREKPILPHGANVPGTVRWQLDSGWQQDTSDGIITYGFANSHHALGLNNNPSFGEGGGYTPFTAAQKAAARIAIANWDDLIAARFVEVQQGPGASDYGRKTTDIMLANTYTGPAQAWAYYPGYENQYARVAGDVWIADPRFNGTNAQLQPGQYGLHTLNHELGHALGLSHPGNYNFGDDQDGDGVADPITYEGDAFYFQDSNQYSIMSYFDSFETGAQNIDWNLMRFIYPSTPMVDDVRVIQQKYGADLTTRTGDTTYGFNFTIDVTNAAMKFNNGEMFTIFTIWDAGGNDTLDLSGYFTDSVIDLRPGAYSSAGGAGAYNPAQLGRELTLAEINANNAAAGFGNRTAALHDIYYDGVAGTNEGLSWKDITGTSGQFLMEQNIGIAYGAIIENAIGGHGNDRINGNQADNRLTGNGGADTFIFVKDGSTDTITDFATGIDKIDLTELKIGSTAVSFNSTTNVLSIDTNGDLAYDMTIIVNGSDLNIATDLLF